MDRNQIIGFVLIAVLLIGYMFFFEKPDLEYFKKQGSESEHLNNDIDGYKIFPQRYRV